MAAIDTEMDAFEVMRRGCPMTRNGNTWTHCDFRMIALNEQHDAIIWPQKSALADVKIPIRAIRSALDGQITETFKADAKKPVEHLSMSIIWTNEAGEEQTYDLICCRRSDQMCWVAGLNQLLQGGITQSCNIRVPEAAVDTSLACILARTKSQQAGRMAWAIPLAIVPIAGIAWLGYTSYYRSQDKKDIVAYRMPELKTLIGYIRDLLDSEDLRGHPYVEGDAVLRIRFIGECYEAAANIKDSVLKETIDAQLHNVAIGMAEAQALYVSLQILEADAQKGKGWFDGVRKLVLGSSTGAAQGDDAEVELGKTAQDLPEIKFDL